MAAPAKMNLNAKKKVRDAQPKIEASVKKCSTAVGIEFQVEIDWDDLYARDTHPEKAFFDDAAMRYLDSLGEALLNQCKDKLLKESLAAACSKKKIAFRWITKQIPQEEIDKYGGKDVWGKSDGGVGVLVEDGVLYIVLSTTLKNWVNNYLQVQFAQFNKLDLAPKGSLPIEAQQCLAKEEKSVLDEVKRISVAVGVEFSLVIDWGEVYKRHPDCHWSTGFTKRIREQLNRLADAVESQCKDAMVKEALAEACSGKRVVVKFHDKPIPEADWGKNGGKKGCAYYTNGDTGVSLEGGDLTLLLGKEWTVNYTHTGRVDFGDML